eukprot:scaffold17750_cov21-Tisochrysis_lutea.AAC.1
MPSSAALRKHQEGAGTKVTVDAGDQSAVRKNSTVGAGTNSPINNPPQPQAWRIARNPGLTIDLSSLARRYRC